MGTAGVALRVIREDGLWLFVFPCLPASAQSVEFVSLNLASSIVESDAENGWQAVGGANGRP